MILGVRTGTLPEPAHPVVASIMATASSATIQAHRLQLARWNLPSATQPSNGKAMPTRGKRVLEAGEGTDDATIVGAAVMVRVVCAGVRPDKVIAGGLNKHVTPAGKVPHEKLTVAKDRTFGVAVIVNVADCPACSVAAVGLADSVYCRIALLLTFCTSVALVCPTKLVSPW